MKTRQRRQRGSLYSHEYLVDLLCWGLKEEEGCTGLSAPYTKVGMYTQRGKRLKQIGEVDVMVFQGGILHIYEVKSGDNYKRKAIKQLEKTRDYLQSEHPDYEIRGYYVTQDRSLGKGIESLVIENVL